MSVNQSSSIQNQPADNSLNNAESGPQALQGYAESGFQILQRHLTAISPARLSNLDPANHSRFATPLRKHGII